MVAALVIVAAVVVIVAAVCVRLAVRFDAAIADVVEPLREFDVDRGKLARD